MSLLNKAKVLHQVLTVLLFWLRISKSHFFEIIFIKLKV